MNRQGSWTVNKILRCAVLALLLALLGCAGSKPAIDDSGGAGGAELHRSGFWMSDLTAEQRRELDRRGAHVLPPQAYVALESLGLGPLPPGGGAGGRSASVLLPYSPPDATQAYMAGEGGWIAHSDDVTINPGPPQASMDMAPTGASFPGNFSYVIYRVDDPTPAPLSLNLLTALTLSEVGVAAYNWSYGALGRWEPLYYGVPENGVAEISLEVGGGADWTNAGGDMAFVVFCLNPATVSVTGFQVSDQSSNAAPTARLAADTGSGQAPLLVNFDASASSDDNAITKYRFDPLGDGSWIDNGADPLFTYTYEFAGAHDVALEVTDGGGLKDTEVRTVIVRFSGYDEQEPNDSKVEANVLPALPISSFTGNCGPDGPHADDLDWFTFDAQDGETVTFLVNHSDLDGSQNFNVYLQDSDDDVMQQSQGYPPSLITHVIGPQDVSPFYLRIVNPSGHSDYIISGSKQAANSYTETEDNDSPGSADRLDDLTDQGEMTDYDASLGDDPPGYVGYDGDSDDWYYFGANVGMELELTLSFDAGTAPEFGVTLFDADVDTPLASVTSTDGTLELNYVFGPGDEEPFFFRIVPTSGYSDYTLNGTLVTQNPGFDEQENNDSQLQANLLPSLPFADFTGNVGLNGSYDGDMLDYFSFIASTGDMYTMTITPANSSAFLQVGVHDSSVPQQQIIGGVARDPGTGIVTVNILIRGNDISPFFLHIEEGSNEETDYTIGAGIADFSETEDNDENGQADALPAGTFQFFSGSIGSGGSDYDGDDLDVFTFDADEGDSPLFTVFFDDVTGTPAGEIYDADGDLLGGWVNKGNRTIEVTTDSPLGPGDVAPYYLEISPSQAGDYTDYWIASGGP